MKTSDVAILVFGHEADWHTFLGDVERHYSSRLMGYSSEDAREIVDGARGETWLARSDAAGRMPFVAHVHGPRVETFVDMTNQTSVPVRVVHVGRDEDGFSYPIELLP